MRLLITGGTGFIGAHFVPRLLAAGHQVVLLDLWGPGEKGGEGEALYIHGDVRDPAVVGRALQGCDAVLHLAAAHHDFGIATETYFSVNEVGTRTLCNAMSQQGVDRLCFYSSVAVYGDGDTPDELEPASPNNDYGRSKLAAERVVSDWVSGEHTRSALVIRPAVVFGPGNFANMFKLIRQIDRRTFFPVGRGENRKSMAFVTNLIDATLYLWELTGPGLSTFNYVDKPDLTSREIIDRVYRSLRGRVPRGHVPLYLALAAAAPIDGLSRLLGRPFPVTRQGIRKLAGVESTFAAARVREVGFEPSVSLDDGIVAMVDWYRTLSGRVGEARIPPREVVLS